MQEVSEHLDVPGVRETAISNSQDLSNLASSYFMVEGFSFDITFIFCLLLVKDMTEELYECPEFV